jgi:hypothetical protein
MSFWDFLKDPIKYAVKETHLKERAGATAINIALKQAKVKQSRSINWQDIRTLQKIKDEMKKDGTL